MSSPIKLGPNEGGWVSGTYSLPAEFLKDGSLDWEKAQAAFLINTTEDLGRLLVYLYAVNTEVNWSVNKQLVSILVQNSRGHRSLPMIPPEFDEYSWFNADMACEKCPGSEMWEISPGYFMPRCLNFKRSDKYSDCLKYRENLTKAQTEISENNSLDGIKLP